jgi:hypothetical protein
MGCNLQRSFLDVGHGAQRPQLILLVSELCFFPAGGVGSVDSKDHLHF